jgi:hypothetical protein
MTAAMEEPAGGRSRIFISYRHEDSEHAVGRLADDLREEFPSERIFLDFSSIDPGANFEVVLHRGLETCAALLVVIGPGWLDATDRKGRRKLDLSDDWVRREITEGLRHRDVRVFPVLLDVDMPAKDELPEDVQPLTTRQALLLTSHHWGYDVGRLVESLKKVPGLGGTAGPASGAAPPPSAPRWLLGVVLAVAVGASLAAAWIFVIRPGAQPPRPQTVEETSPGPTPTPTALATASPPIVNTSPAIPIKLSEPWKAYRFDVFWCDSDGADAEGQARRLSSALRSIGVNDVRVKQYNDTFKARAEEQGFAGDLRAPAAIRYFGEPERSAALEAKTFVAATSRIDLVLEEVSPESPTPGILSIFLCPSVVASHP